DTQLKPGNTRRTPPERSRSDTTLSKKSPAGRVARRFDSLQGNVDVDPPVIVVGEDPTAPVHFLGVVGTDVGTDPEIIAGAVGHALARLLLRADGSERRPLTVVPAPLDVVAGGTRDRRPGEVAIVAGSPVPRKPGGSRRGIRAVVDRRVKEQSADDRVR